MARYLLTVSALAVVGMMTTGCATKKYVGQRIAPVETKAAQLEQKNGEQDATLKAHGDSIDGVEKNLSRTKEQLADVDTRARQAGTDAQAAGTKAGEAMSRADNARMLAEKGIAQGEEIRKTIDGVNTFKLATSQSVLFDRDRATLNADAKQLLDELSKNVSSNNRYVIEVQGYTDKTGSPMYNVNLSQKRAEEVARYLTNNEKIPLRSIHMLGSGIAGDEQKTAEARKLSRRVEIKVWVPEVDSASKSMSAAAGTN
jgi:outer membrane protein OmpA-like peptidoglycan-associated protein